MTTAADLSSQDPTELTTKSAAEFLGISQRTFNRRERTGFYVPTRIDERGWKFYDVGYLAKMKRRVPGYTPDDGSRVVPSTGAINPSSKNLELGRLPKQPRPTSPAPEIVYSPSDAVRVFAQLKKDEDLVRIVMELDMDPAVVDAIHEQWRKLRSKSGGFQLSGETIERLNRLPLDGFPVRSQKDLELALEALASSADPCESCGVASRRQSRVCQRCYEAQQRRVLAEAVATEVASRKSVKGAGAKKS